MQTKSHVGLAQTKIFSIQMRHKQYPCLYAN